MHAPLEALLKTQRRRLVAHLARSLGLAHLALAEDAVQVAALRALQAWPADGVPANPAGWLFRVARHHAIDVLRAADRHVDLPDSHDHASDEGSMPLPLTVPAAEGRLAGELDDDELALLFAACHPALPMASQVALALRAMTALELPAIAEGLFCSEAALAQRLARARTLLKDQHLALPAGAELPARREAVLTTLQLMFAAGLKASGREGAAPSAGAAPETAMALCWEAIRLARAVAAHRITAHAEADALAALLLFHGARLTGRLDEAGDMVPLPGQPRDRWDAGLVRMGFGHLQASQRAERLSRYHLQAGIAAEHAMAADYAHTDWSAIVGYYELLVAMDPSAAPRLGHAIALAEAGSAADAQGHLERLLPDTPQALRAHTLAALSRAHERQGRQAEAVMHLQRAIQATQHAADARLLQRRLDALGDLREG